MSKSSVSVSPPSSSPPSARDSSSSSSSSLLVVEAVDVEGLSSEDSLVTSAFVSSVSGSGATEGKKSQFFNRKHF